MTVLPWLVGGVLGLLVGSFLNVLIHRLPRMMERQWVQDMAHWQRQTDGQVLDPAPLSSTPPMPPAFNLARPGSHCPACSHALRWYEIIPLLSFACLRGRCAACGVAISWRYPLVEAATAALFCVCLLRWGWSPAAWLWCGFSATLLALACIDLDTQLLPDDLTLPLLWVGLAAAALGWNLGVGLEQALWGAIAGYLSLWLVYQTFKLVTGKEGMGHGDFKLLAALGAWFGWQALLPLVLMASLSGAVVGLGQRATGRLLPGQAIAFGPYLAAAGFALLLCGPGPGATIW